MVSCILDSSLHPRPQVEWVFIRGLKSPTLPSMSSSLLLALKNQKQIVTNHMAVPVTHMFAHACRFGSSVELVNDPTISKHGMGTAGRRPGCQDDPCIHAVQSRPDLR